MTINQPARGTEIGGRGWLPAGPAGAGTGNGATLVPHRTCGSVRHHPNRPALPTSYRSAARRALSLTIYVTERDAEDRGSPRSTSSSGPCERPQEVTRRSAGGGLARRGARPQGGYVTPAWRAVCGRFARTRLGIAVHGFAEWPTAWWGNPALRWLSRTCVLAPGLRVQVPETRRGRKGPASGCDCGGGPRPSPAAGWRRWSRARLSRWRCRCCRSSPGSPPAATAPGTHGGRR